MVKKLLGTGRMADATHLSEGHLARPLVCKSEAMLALLDSLRRIALVPYPVLIQAPQGSEVEAVARFLHEHGPQSQAPFLAVPCDSSTQTDLDSLFRSLESLPGSRSAPPSTPAYGTVFFQDVTALPRQFQSRLESLVSERREMPRGNPQAIPRIVVSSARELGKAVSEGTFNSGLYYAFTACAVAVPPLSKRRADIPDLVRALLTKHCQIQRKSRRIGEQTIDRLAAHCWPGDVSELEGAIVDGIIHSCDEEVMPTDLPALASQPASASPPANDVPPLAVLAIPTDPSEVHRLKSVLACAERAYIKATLRIFGGDKDKATKALGISIGTLYRKLPPEEEMQPADLECHTNGSP
jgi:DNA-binding NtrC family response regulator